MKRELQFVVSWMEGGMLHFELYGTKSAALAFARKLIKRGLLVDVAQQ